MARYKVVDMSPRLLPVDLEAQLMPGSFAHAVHHVVDALDLSAFDVHYRNDAVGASAHAPAALLKAVLLAYSQGMISSRAIERACRDNVLFIALTGDAKPHFTTIADFVSRSREAIASVFGQVLALLGNEGLIGRTMFAIDGVKLPSNASKHRSGMRSRCCRRSTCDPTSGATRPIVPMRPACWKRRVAVTFARCRQGARDRAGSAGRRRQRPANGAAHRLDDRRSAGAIVRLVARAGRAARAQPTQNLCLRMRKPVALCVGWTIEDRPAPLFDLSRVPVALRAPSLHRLCACACASRPRCA